MAARFEIEFSAEALDALDVLEAYDRSIILDAIEDQLRYQPTAITRNRKQ